MTPELTTLPSGLRVISQNLPGVESVAVAMSVAVGARYEDIGENGISHLLEHMAFKGTKRRSARQIAEEFDTIGGQFNAYTSLEHTVYYAKVLKQNLPLAVDILSDILEHSVLDETELKREQGVICQEIAMHFDAPDDLIFDYFDSTAFPDQPLGRSILGTPERINAYTRDEVRGYMCKHYAHPRMVLSAAGNVNHAELTQLAEQFFHQPPCTSADIHMPEAARYVGGESRNDRKLEQLHLMLGFPAFSVHHHDYYVLQLYSSILGGGMSSRLFQEVREKRGLAYHVNSMISAYSDCGMISVYSATGEDEAAELPLILADEIKKMAFGVEATELTRAKNQLKSEVLMSKENVGGVAGWIGKHLLIFGRVRTVEEISAAIDAVTHADIKRIAELVLTGGPPTMAALGPVRKLPGYETVVERLK